MFPPTYYGSCGMFEDIFANYEEQPFTPPEPSSVLGEVSNLLEQKDADFWNSDSKTDALPLEAFDILRSRPSLSNVLAPLPKSGQPILKEDFQHDENGILRTYKINDVEALRTIPPTYYLNESTSSPVLPDTETASQSTELSLETVEEAVVEDSHLAAQAELERLEDSIYELDVIRVGDKDEAGTSTEVNPHEISRSSTPSSLFGDDLIEGCDTEHKIEEGTVMNSPSSSSRTVESCISSVPSTPPLYFTPSSSPSTSSSPPLLQTPPISYQGVVPCYTNYPQSLSTHNDTYDTHLFPPHPTVVHCNHSHPQGVPPPVSSAPCPTLPTFSPSIFYASQPPVFVQGSSRDDQVAIGVSTASTFQGTPVAGLFWNFPTQVFSQEKRKAEDSTPEPHAKRRRPNTKGSPWLVCLYRGCPTPHKLYPNTKERNRHMDTHFKHRFACPACKVSFSRPESVRRHIRSVSACRHDPRCVGKTLKDFEFRKPRWEDFPWRKDELSMPDSRDPVYRFATRASP